jgi:DNA-directed RNA polymerase sigma subunit (sigma70/sigma32)
LAEKKTTLQALASRYDISAERVRQIEQRAIKSLRTKLSA